MPDISDIISPYNFVPPPGEVVRPSWADHVSHDVPFADGLDGWLDIEIKAETDLFVGGRESAGASTFFRDHEGRFAVPGTSIRGMLRSVVEIASFGWLGPVNDHRFGFRDLQNAEEYQRHMAAIIDREPTPLVNAGWLVREWGPDGQRWSIRPCHYAQIEYAELEKLAQQVKITGFQPNRKQASVVKYQAWGNQAFARYRLPITLKQPAGRSTGGVTRLSSYGKVTVVGGMAQEGRLVFTGQPQDRQPGDKHKKHHDFFFYGQAGAPLTVTPRQRQDFEFIHSDGRQQGKDTLDPNPEWRFWRNLRDVTDRLVDVPVFFLLNGNGSLRAFGLAQMFRLAYDHTTGEAVRNGLPKNLPWPDLASTLFGHVEGPSGEVDTARGALRGRVSIGLGRLVGEGRELPEVVGVFGAPKASFYPHYLMQGEGPDDEPERDQKNKPRWITYMSKNAQARGWKRYQPRGQAQRQIPMPNSVQENHQTRFKPLAAGARFRARIRVHNLRPVELGALLWALDFGGHPGAVHRLGRGRPYGFGSVTAQVVDKRLRWADPERSAAIEHSRLVEEYRGFMQAHTNGQWATSRTLFELLKMTEPLSTEEAGRVRYPLIEPTNEFNEIKKRGLLLRPRGGAAAWQAWRGRVVRPAPWSDSSNWPESTRLLRPANAPQTQVNRAPEPVAATLTKPSSTKSDHGVRQLPLPSPETWMEVKFRDFNGARQTRQSHRRNSAREYRLDLIRVPGGQPVGALSTASTADFSPLFDKLAQSNAPFSFFARAVGGQVLQVALIRPTDE